MYFSATHMVHVKGQKYKTKNSCHDPKSLPEFSKSNIFLCQFKFLVFLYHQVHVDVLVELRISSVFMDKCQINSIYLYLKYIYSYAFSGYSPVKHFLLACVTHRLLCLIYKNIESFHLNSILFY